MNCSRRIERGKAGAIIHRLHRTSPSVYRLWSGNDCNESSVGLAGTLHLKAEDFIDEG